MAGHIWQKCQGVGRRLSSLIKRLDSRPLLEIIVISFLIDFILEALGRHSVADSFIHLVTNPLIFGVNLLIILATYLISLFVPKRNFVITVLTIIWLCLGMTNCILLIFGTTPLSATHIALMPSVFSVLSFYLEVWQIILICILILLLAYLLVLCWRRTEKKRVAVKRSLIESAIVVSVLVVSLVFISKVERTSEDFGNLISANEHFGFAYCFICFLKYQR
jgi:hypothetical protein